MEEQQINNNNKMIQRISLASYPSHFHEATQSLQTKNYNQAEIQYQKCLQSNPSSYSSYLNLAYIRYVRKDYEGAIRLCDVAINMKPYCPEAYYNRCLAFAARGQEFYGEAIGDARCAVSCGFLERFKGTGELGMLEKAVEYSGNNLEALRLLVLFAREKKQYYRELLAKCQDSYAIDGQLKCVKACASAEQGLFRLKSYSSLSTISNLKQTISEYLHLQQPQPLPTPTPTLNRPSSISLESCLYNVTIEASETAQSQPQSDSQIDELNTYSYEKIQPRRYSTNEGALRQISSYRLNVPSQFDTRYSLVDSVQFRSPLRQSSICDGMTGSRVSHNGCLKCKRESDATAPVDGIKLLIKTIEIYRNENIYQPKPYLIIYDGQKEHVTEIDHQGGHFPKWSQPFYLKKQTQNPYRIELWHKDYKQKEDQLIGTASFQSKQGRFKCHFIKRHGGTKKTGYIFLQLGK